MDGTDAFKRQAEKEQARAEVERLKAALAAHGIEIPEE